VADVAVAELTDAKSVKNHVVLEWDTQLPTEHEKLYALGTPDTGSHATLDNTGKPAVSLRRCLLGGIRYTLAVRNFRDQINYHTCPLLWRSRRRSVRGLSGAALIRRNAIGKFHLAAFQSHELYMDGENTSWWKVAFTPPHRMRRDFVAVAPRAVLAKHDPTIEEDDSEWEDDTAIVDA
jgi:hypothetical protein